MVELDEGLALLLMKMVPLTVDEKTTLPPGVGADWVIVKVNVSTSGDAGARRGRDGT